MKINTEKNTESKESRKLGYSYFGVDDMGLNFRPQIFFDAPDDKGGGGDDTPDDKPDDKPDDTPDDKPDDKDTPDIEAIKKELEKEHKKELDRYRNDIGQLKKDLKEMKEKGMTEEEKLAQKEKDLEAKELDLRVKELDAHKSQQIAEQELDKRLAEYIKVNAENDNPEDNITESIKTLKSAVDSIVQERIEKLQESGSVLNGFNFNSGNKGKKSTIGEQLANFNKENNKGAAEAQKEYFN